MRRVLEVGPLVDNDEIVCVEYANGGFGASGPDLAGYSPSCFKLMGSSCTSTFR